MEVRAALYSRASLDRSGEGLAVSRQEEDGLRLIELRGWTHAETYRDNDLSAAGTKFRPGFEALLEAVQAGSLDVVVAWSLDRLTRNRRDQLRLIETCHRGTVNLALVRGSDMDLSSAVGRAVVDILSTTARLENEQKSERQVRANAQAAEQGRMNGGRRAFGYSADGLHLDPHEAPLVQQMYERFARHESLGAIARWLNDLNVPTARGNRWRVETVRVILSNPRNAGLRARRSVDPNTGVRQFFHDEPVAVAVWPAIVPEETWRRTVRDLRRPERRRSSSTRPRYLLSGASTCGVCGEPCLTSWAHGYRVLRCRTRKHVARRAEPIEDFVVEALMARLQRPDAADLFPAPGDGEDLDAIRLAIAEHRAALVRLGDDYDDPAMKMARDEYLRRRERIQTRLDELDDRIATAGAVDVLAPLRAAVDPNEVWEHELSDHTRREVVRRAMRVIVLSGRPGQPGGVRFQEDTVRIEWRR